MTPLRAKYIGDLVIHGRSKNTQKAYTRCVCDLARYYRRSPELISYEEVTGWLHHLIKERQLAASSVNIAVSAVRFLYAVTLGRETLELMASVSDMKRATRRAEVYARSEIEAILTAPRQPRDRVLLMTVYGCGLRISEATQLKTSDIDRARMQLRVRDGKGAKGRVLPLSERLLKELVNYWRAQRQGKAGHDSPWLFLGKKAGQPMGRYTGQNIYYTALEKSGVRRKGGIHLLRHYPGFRTIASKPPVAAPNPLLTGVEQHWYAGLLGIVRAALNSGMLGGWRPHLTISSMTELIRKTLTRSHAAHWPCI
jgi:integrase/recombinase XerD